MRSALGALVVAVSAYALVVSGVLPEPVSLILVAGLLVTVPSARRLAPRLAVNVALLAGWVPLLWWVDWPMPVNHGAAVIAVVAASLTAYVLASSTPRRRLASLVPRLGVADALLPLGVAVAAAATHPLTFASTPLKALTVLVPGADNWAHFNMFSTMRAHGPMTGSAGPNGETWAFAEYPKGFHGLVATLSEVTFPDMTTGPQSLVAYAHTVGVVVALGILLITAVVLSLPGLGSRPELAGPAVVVTWTALLWEPGQKVLANGFASFWLGCVAGGSALLLGLVTTGQVRQPVRVLAVAGLLVCVFLHLDAPGIIAAPAAVAVLVRQSRGAELRHRRLWTVAVLVVGAAAVAKVLTVLFGVVPVVPGGRGERLRRHVPLADADLAAPARLRAAELPDVGPDPDRRALDRATDRRLRWLTLAPVLGVLSLTALLVLQLRVLGTTSYYFLKYLVGFELILACVTPAVCALLLATVTAAPRRRGLTTVAAALAVALATQAFGNLSAGQALLLSDTDDGTAAVRSPYSRDGDGRGDPCRRRGGDGSTVPRAGVSPARTGQRGRDLLPGRVVPRHERQRHQHGLGPVRRPAGGGQHRRGRRTAGAHVAQCGAGPDDRRGPGVRRLPARRARGPDLARRVVPVGGSLP